MKKLLGAVLCAALVIPSGPLSAELLKNLKVSGGVEIRATSAENVNDFATHAPDNLAVTNKNDHVGNVQTRTNLKLDWDLLEDVHASVMLRKNDRTWGTTGDASNGNANVSQAASNQTLLGSNSNPAFLDNVYVQQANIKIDKVAGMWDVTAGRQFYGEPGDLIVHYGFKPSYGLTTTSIDAFRVDGMNDWFDWTGIAGQTTGDPLTITTPPTASVDVRGLEVMAKNIPWGLKVNPYVYSRVTHGTAELGTSANGGRNDNLWVYGARLKWKNEKGCYASAVVGLNAGENRAVTTGSTGRSANYEGKALLVKIGHKQDTNWGAINPWADWGWGSGRRNVAENRNEDFQGIAASYRPGLFYGRFTSSDGGTLGSGLGAAMDGTAGVSRLGLTNRIVWGAGVKHTPAQLNKLTWGVAYWDYSFAHTTLNPITGSATNPIGDGNRHIGSEIDLSADWKHSDNVLFSLALGSFLPGGYVNNVIRDANPTQQVRPATMAMFDTSVKF